MSIRPFLCVVLALAAFASVRAHDPVADTTSTSTPAASPAISPQELAQRIGADDAPPLILDVRTRAEYDAGHVPRARLIPHDELAAALDNLKAFQHAEIVVYCRSGRRSALAEALLRAHDFTDVAQLDGSWNAWQDAKLPVELTSSEKPE